MPLTQLPPDSESLGQYLQRSRKEKGLTIEHYGAETRISERNLRAMEDDDFANLPAEAFARGLYGLYAKALGLNSDEIIARFIVDMRKAIPQEYGPGSPYAAPGMDSGRVNSMAEGPAISPIFAFVLLLFLLFGVSAGLSWYFQFDPVAFVTGKVPLLDKPIGSSEEEQTAADPNGDASPEQAGQPGAKTAAEGAKSEPPTATQPVPTESAPLPAAATSGGASGQVAPTESSLATPPAAPPAQPPAKPAVSSLKYTRQAVFYEKTTLSLTIDDGTKEQLTYQAGDRMVWHAATKMVLTLPTGNSTRFSLNDIPLVLPPSKERETILAIPENLLD